MRALFVCFVLFSIGVVQGQDTTLKKDSLTNLRKRFKEEYEIQSGNAQAYSRQKNIPISYFTKKGNLVSLTGMDDAETPRYITIENAGAAITTGVVKLREGGGLGLDLQGEGMKVGVWDEGSIRTDHVEFDQRILQSQGSVLSEHSTHVTGTIMASGVNPNAKGMAPKAKVASWDWINDLSEMASEAKSDQTGLLLSNHSYGTLTGWEYDGTWSWYGNSTISNQEDYRFGFYSNTTKSWDALAYNAPYYTICKAAGNDRSDTGGTSGQYPADCDGGSGYDCLGDVAVAKNIITVGAISKITNYTGPSSAVMSSFSSWGPTDDGRIKPDLVGAGVNIFSTFPSTTTSYATLNGTSMASPNVAGSLILLQELYKKINSNYMRAATLKALAIHTIKEAGTYPGPDYKFGWGLLDVEAAAKAILHQDNINIQVKEMTLINGQTIEVDLDPVENQKITATIVWTDPAGIPASPALDPQTLMLVNNLDIRIVDSGNGVYYPWILNPLAPNAAADKGDNFRDNVEKIEFDNPQARLYKLNISHKAQLQGGSQPFSLIISYTSNNDRSVAYYWVGDSGSWGDPAHWSLTSGGPSAGAIPTADDRVFFDENSFSGDNNTINFTQDAASASFTWFASETASIVLNGNTLSIGGNMIVTSSKLSASGNGKIIFTGNKSDQNRIALTDNLFDDIDFEFNGNSSWTVEKLKQVQSIELTKGNLQIAHQTVDVKRLIANSGFEKTLDISSTSLTNIEETVISSENLTLNSGNAGLYLAASADAIIYWSGVDYNGLIKLSSSAELRGENNQISSIAFAGEVLISGSNVFDTVAVASGTIIKLAQGVTQTLSQHTIISASESAPVTMSADQNAILLFDGHYKLCFDYLDVSNVDVQGSAIVNAGEHSKIVGVQSWYTLPCGDILFPDFNSQSNCVSSLTQFQNLSTGKATSWLWNFGDSPVEAGTSTLKEVNFIFRNEGTYAVTLSISDGIHIESYTKNIVIGPNDIAENRIVLSSGKLYSYQSASTYQWYKDGIPIPGETGRSYEFDNQNGVYFVVIQNSGCNRISTEYINAVTEVENEESSIAVFPNPASKELYVKASEGVDIRSVYLYDILGNLVLSKQYNGQSHIENPISLNGLQNGIYMVRVTTADGRHNLKRIMVK